MTKFADYAEKYAVCHMERDESGVLLVRLHTDGGVLQIGSDRNDTHQLADAFYDIANDPENRAVLLTGTGDAFCLGVASGQMKAHSTPMGWDRVYRNRRRLLLNFLEIEAPVVSAINGPALVHSELPLLGDIVLASSNTIFQDEPHFLDGGTPGDGAHVVWPLLLGPVRAKYFLLTGQKIDAQQALDLGVVSEVLEPDELLPRAWDLAHYITARPVLSGRYTRAVLNFALRQAMQDYLGYGLAIEGLAAVQLQGWRMHEGGDAPAWPT
jgi:enoyl-CoA hydratase/carnithine racemase